MNEIIPYRGHIGNIRRPLEERLWPRVIKSENCWEWTGSIDGRGYGVIGSETRPYKAQKVHITVYLLLVGEYDRKLDLHHTCENKKCCNPAHLMPLTRKAHIALTPRKSLRGRKKANPVTSCRAGHLLDHANTYVGKNGRNCRACNLIYTRRRRGLPDEGNGGKIVPKK